MIGHRPLMGGTDPRKIPVPALKGAFFGMAAGALLIGCQPQADRIAAPVTGLRLQPAPTGVAVIGSGGREIGYGRDRVGALETAGRVTGRRAEPKACLEAGRDAVTFGDLVLIFDGKALTGATDPTGSFGTVCTT